ncbi:hypothetical protein CHUAL_006723 [Chamberlinius hualienensis]
MIFFASIIFYMNLIVAQSSAICDGSVYGNMYDLIDGVSNCTFPYYKITSDIVRDGCPQLTTESLCPFNADKSLNKINIEKTVEIVKNCLKQPKFGDIETNSITIPSVTYSVNEILQGFGLTGECTIPLNTSFVYNVNNTLITVTDVQDTVNFSINVPNIIYQGEVNCKFTLPLIKPIAMNNVDFYATVAFTSKSSVSLNNNNPVPEIQFPTVTINIQYDFLKLPILDHIPLGKLFSNFYQKIFDKTKISELFGKFIAAFVSGALEITKTQCS